MSELDRFVALLEICISGASRDPVPPSRFQLRKRWLPDNFSMAKALQQPERRGIVRSCADNNV
jgi:hypothetical protein